MLRMLMYQHGWHCRFTMFGDAINLAARLMGVASRNGQAVLCDSRTREMARGSADFVALEPMLVKVGA
jgi:class 3 adenylate cyclase